MITPSLKLKTNELFFKWFTETDRNDQLKDPQIQATNCYNSFYEN